MTAKDQYNPVPEPRQEDNAPYVPQNPVEDEVYYVLNAWGVFIAFVDKQYCVVEMDADNEKVTDEIGVGNTIAKAFEIGLAHVIDCAIEAGIATGKSQGGVE